MLQILNDSINAGILYLSALSKFRYENKLNTKLYCTCYFVAFTINVSDLLRPKKANTEIDNCYCVVHVSIDEDNIEMYCVRY